MTCKVKNGVYISNRGFLSFKNIQYFYRFIADVFDANGYIFLIKLMYNNTWKRIIRRSTSLPPESSKESLTTKNSSQITNRGYLSLKNALCFLNFIYDVFDVDRYKFLIQIIRNKTWNTFSRLLDLYQTLSNKCYGV